MSNFSKILFAASLSLSGLAASSALADGTNRDPDTGVILCKGKSFCDSLKTSCAGTYEDATQTDGTIYGQCTPSKRQSAPTALKTN
jgi:hypothetical protein